MRARAGAGSKSRRRARLYRTGKIFTGRAEEAEAHIDQALRLSPRDTSAYAWSTKSASRKITWAIASKPSCGVAERSKPIGIIPRLISTWPPPSRGWAGSMRPRSAVKSGLALNPSFTVSRAVINWTAMSDDPTHPQQLAPHFRRPAQHGPSTDYPTRPKRREDHGPSSAPDASPRAVKTRGLNSDAHCGWRRRATQMAAEAIVLMADRNDPSAPHRAGCFSSPASRRRTDDDPVVTRRA